MVVVRHQKRSCFIVGESVLGVVALDMQGRCLSEYEPNSSETVPEE